MITRRSFLAALAGLPFVGKLISQQPTCAIEANIASWPKPAPDPWVPMTLEGHPVYFSVDATGQVVDGKYFLSFPDGPSWSYRDGEWRQNL